MSLFLLFIWPWTGSKSPETDGTSPVQTGSKIDVDKDSSAVIMDHASYILAGLKKPEVAFSVRLLVKKPLCKLKVMQSNSGKMLF